MSHSVPANFHHDWTYRGHWGETKVRKGLWRFRFKATKHRHATSEGNFGIGTTGAWRINGIQYIRKTGTGRYQTELIGTKIPLKFNVRKPRRRRWARHSRY